MMNKKDFKIKPSTAGKWQLTHIPSTAYLTWKEKSFRETYEFGIVNTQKSQEYCKEHLPIPFSDALLSLKSELINAVFERYKKEALPDDALNEYYRFGELCAYAISISGGSFKISDVAIYPSQISHILADALSQNSHEDYPMLSALNGNISKDIISTSYPTTEQQGQIIKGYESASCELTRKSIGAYVIKARNEQNITQTQLANSANITSANLSRLEKGQSNVTIDTLNRVFVALGKTLKLVE